MSNGTFIVEVKIGPMYQDPAKKPKLERLCQHI